MPLNRKLGRAFTWGARVGGGAFVAVTWGAVATVGSGSSRKVAGSGAVIAIIAGASSKTGIASVASGTAAGAGSGAGAGDTTTGALMDVGAGVRARTRCSDGVPNRRA